MPYRAGNVQEPKRTGATTPLMPVDLAVLQKVEEMTLAIAPAGIDSEVITKAINAVSSKPGSSFRNKQLAGWSLLGQGKLEDGDLELEATFMVVKSAKQLQLATITLSVVECLMPARVSAAHADFMRLETDGMRDCILAVITRNFSNKHFTLSKFLMPWEGLHILLF